MVLTKLEPRMKTGVPPLLGPLDRERYLNSISSWYKKSRPLPVKSWPLMDTSKPTSLPLMFWGWYPCTCTGANSSLPIGGDEQVTSEPDTKVAGTSIGPNRHLSDVELTKFSPTTRTLVPACLAGPDGGTIALTRTTW